MLLLDFSSQQTLKEISSISSLASPESLRAASRILPSPPCLAVPGLPTADPSRTHCLIATGSAASVEFSAIEVETESSHGQLTRAATAYVWFLLPFLFPWKWTSDHWE